jgi:septal ring factor EnvC (AmiA/AmiB activator)
MIGTEEELRTRLENFDSHMASQRNEKRKQDDSLSEIEEELRQTRKAHVHLTNEHGALKSDARVGFIKSSYMCSNSTYRLKNFVSRRERLLSVR